MSKIARVEPGSAVLDAPASMLALLERAARDPSVDIDKFERLMLMKERTEAQYAKTVFDQAMSEMQPELPVIKERGKAIVAGQIRYTYALWEDINDQIKPVLMKHGFAITFRTDFANGIAVTGVLSHRGGHREETSIVLPADTSGSKNPVQAVASTVSYGKRYAAGALLNLTSHGEDDDAYGSCPPAKETSGKPVDGAWEQSESIGFGRDKLEPIAMNAIEYRDMGDIQGAYDFIASKGLPHEAITALWTLFDSKFRSALKKCKPQ